MNAKSPGLIFGALKTSASSFIEDNALRLSAALAYYSIFSIAPLIVLAIGLAGLFFGAQAVSGQLDDQMKGMIGAQGAEALQSMIKSASNPASSIWATIIGVVTLLFGASGMFGQLKDALNTIWEVKQKPGLGVKGFLRERFLSFGMVVIIGFLLLVSLMLTAFLSAFNHWIEGALSLPAWFWGVIGFLVSFGVVVLLFASIFKILPDVEIAWKHVWIGAIATALLFEIGKFLLGWYLGRPSTTSSFGAAGSVVLLLLWVYYASCILLFGAEFTQAYAVATGAELKPSKIAEPVTAEARAQQGISGEKAASATAGAPSSGGTGGKPGTPRGPAREYPRVILSAPLPKPKTVPPFPRKLHEVPHYLRDHPTAGFAAALAGGFAVGLVSRLSERKQVEATPVQHLKEGSRGLALAALLLLSRGVRGLFRAGYRVATSTPVQNVRQRVREAVPVIIAALVVLN